MLCEKEKGTGARLPVALAAHATKSHEDRRLAVGMDGYLTKSIRPRELHDLLKSHLARRVEQLATVDAGKNRNRGQ